MLSRIAILLLISPCLLFAGPVIMPATGKAGFSLSDETVCGLSGLTWARGDLFYAVSDRQRAILPLRLSIDPSTGAITAGKLEPPVLLQTVRIDFEDIGFDHREQRVFVSTEDPPGIQGFSLTGKPLAAVNLPAVFLRARNNLSMESLTMDAAAGRAWTANEDTLPADGPVSARDAGGLVRLQEFDAQWRPLRQFAWRTEPSKLRIHGSGTGVSGLCLLPDGSLLVMERVVAGLHLEVQIFLADFSGAADTGKLVALAGASCVPARKQLLYKQKTGLTNFEGIASGAVLKDGSRSLILVADSGESGTHEFLALRVAAKPVKK